MNLPPYLGYAALAGEWVMIGLQIFVGTFLLRRMVRSEVARRLAAIGPPQVKVFLNGEEMTPVPEPADDPPPRTH